MSIIIMKISEIIVLFLLLLIVLGGLSVPLWWDRAQPFVFSLPGYIAGIIRELKDSLDYILKNIKYTG
jgi:predicted PurR-regulated permease PerM